MSSNSISVETPIGCSAGSRKKVAYYFDDEVGNFYYGQAHPMKPLRIKMAHNLLLNYGLYDKMTIYRPHLAQEDEVTMFHSDDYVKFLKQVTVDNMNEVMKHLQRFNVGEDCPVFDGMWKFCQISAGGSIGGAVKLNNKAADVAVNWAGGLHHAKKTEASGFCYVNDIVLAILELLKYHQRVLYIDIDIHHGDGVEEAFYTTDRVMCVSLHKFGHFFPGTGDVRDIGAGKGKHYSLNFPLQDGVDDFSYESIFKPLITEIVNRYRPGAIVLQCGADSLTGDRLGCFNLSIEGHAKCVKLVKSFDLPLLIVGGGGYTIRNVARCWTYETACLIGADIPNALPYNDYLEYFGPDYALHIPPTNMENKNTRDYLDEYLSKLLETLSNIEPAPSAQMGSQLDPIPPDAVNYKDQPSQDELLDPDQRLPTNNRDTYIENPGALHTRSDPHKHKDRRSSFDPAKFNDVDSLSPNTTMLSSDKEIIQSSSSSSSSSSSMSSSINSSQTQNNTTVDPNEQSLLLFCHGGMEMGIEPKQFLAQESAKRFHRLEKMSRRTQAKNFTFRRPSDRQGLSDTDLAYNGFMWSDFCLNRLVETLSYNPGRGYVYSKPATEHLLKSYSTQGKNNIRVVLRGHQHSIDQGILFHLINKEGVLGIWADRKNKAHPRKKKKDDHYDEKPHVIKFNLQSGNLVYTLLSAPSSSLLFGVDNFVNIHVPSENFDEWRLYQVARQIKGKSDDQQC